LVWNNEKYTENNVLVYNPSIPADFNTLKEFKPDTGYQIRMLDKGEVDFG